MTLGRFDSTKVSLRDLLRDIQAAKIQLPDFQRGWVWDDERVRSLVASISLSFPIGAIMLLETGNPAVRFKPRPVEGVREGPREPECLILDGQQRLTSLYQALLMDEPVATKDAKKATILRWYYIDLAKALDPNMDREEAVFGVPPNRVVKNFRAEVILDLSTQEKECAAEALPVNLLYDIAGLTQWQMSYLQIDEDRLHERLERWNRVIEEIVQPFQQYQMPQIQLGRETSKEAVCKVFEKVNTGGVSLTVFELLTATYAADNYSLRDDWAIREHRLRERPVLRNVESTDFLQTIALLSTLDRKRRIPDAPVGCKRRDLLELELDEYQRWCEPATLGYEHAARFLVEEKLFAARDIPYRTQLIPLAAILADLGDRAEGVGVRDRLRQWYWCGVLGELYGGAIETRFAKDVPQTVEWIGGGTEPDTVGDANFVPMRLRTLRSRLSAAYKGIQALLMRDGAEDFMTGRTIDSQLYFDDRIDIHHIFPASWCRKADIPGGLADCVVNKTPLSAATNRAIGGAAPAEYLARIERNAKITRERMDGILETHLVDIPSMRANDFGAFFKAREQALIDRIERVMGKPVMGAAAPRPEAVGPPEGWAEGTPARPGALPRVPDDSLGVLVVEGETDKQYLRLAADAAGRPELLKGIHVLACEGANGVVQAAVGVKNEGAWPIVALFDKDEPGKAARDTLLRRFDFAKQQVMTYGEALEGNPDNVEAEDLFPPKLLQRFVEEFGEENVLSEKQMHPQLKTWHYGFNAAGKEAIGEFLSAEVVAGDVTRWITLLETIRTRLGLAVPPPDGSVSAQDRSALLDAVLEAEEEEEYFGDDGEGPDIFEGGEPGGWSNEKAAHLDGLLSELRDRVLRLGSDVAVGQAHRYVSFSRSRVFLAVQTRRTDLKLFLALGPDFEDPRGLVHRRGSADSRPESVWSHFAFLGDLSMMESVIDLVRQSYERVGPLDPAETPWLADGRAWHLEQRCHVRGRQIVEKLLAMIAEAAPEAAGPKWGQKNYIAWERDGHTWIRLGTRPAQASLVILHARVSPEAAAAQLGFELFEQDAELSDKLALGSSVALTRAGKGLRILVKDPRDLDHNVSSRIVELLRDSWEYLSA